MAIGLKAVGQLLLATICCLTVVLGTAGCGRRERSLRAAAYASLADADIEHYAKSYPDTRDAAEMRLAMAWRRFERDMSYRTAAAFLMDYRTADRERYSVMRNAQLLPLIESLDLRKAANALAPPGNDCASLPEAKIEAHVNAEAEAESFSDALGVWLERSLRRVASLAGIDESDKSLALLRIDVDMTLRAIDYACVRGDGTPCTFSSGEQQKSVAFPTIEVRFAARRGGDVLEAFQIDYSQPIPPQRKILDLPNSARFPALGRFSMEIATIHPNELMEVSGTLSRLRQALYSVCGSPALLLPFGAENQPSPWAMAELTTLVKIDPLRVSRYVGSLLTTQPRNRDWGVAILEAAGVTEAAELLLIASGSDPADPSEKLITRDNLSRLRSETIAPYLERSRDRYYRELYDVLLR